MMEGDRGLRAQREPTPACQDALQALDGNAPLGVMGLRLHPPVGGVARRGGASATRCGASAWHSGGAPVAGFYTYGEIARTRGHQRLSQPDAGGAGV